METTYFILDDHKFTTGAQHPYFTPPFDIKILSGLQVLVDPVHDFYIYRS